MLKKCFLPNSKLKNWRFTKKEKHKGLAMPQDSNMSQSKTNGIPHFDMFSYMDPLEVALIKDTLSNDFEFDWEAVMRSLKGFNSNLGNDVDLFSQE